MYNRLKSGTAKMAVVGLGYVGLPLALEFARKFEVIGFDIKPSVVEKLKNKIDPAGEVEPEKFDGTNIKFTSNPDDLGDVNFYIVAVPTPIDHHRQPDLSPLLGACSLVGKYLNKGDYVVFESTVYPGCTEEDCVPVMERESGLKYIEDFKVGYSPERINPGDKVHTLTSVVKITSGCDEESSENIARVYEEIVGAGIYKAASIRVAEAAKIIENTQRDVNIAIMNEFSRIFNYLDINTYDVINAAGTKWNFLKFSPGLVGGHCIGVDPYYLIFKARQYGYEPYLLSSARALNDDMGLYVANNTVKLLAKNDLPVGGANILVLGVTFKENVADIRNSKIVDIVNELKDYNIYVQVADPKADPEEVEHEYGITLDNEIRKNHYHAIVVGVNHNEYRNYTEQDFRDMLEGGKGLIIDIKGIYKDKIKSLPYWSL